MHEMEARLREYKCIELIYKEHTGEFEQEMRKYTTTSGTASIVNCQSLIRQLVSTNVLLKEQLDKQTEDKKVLRKKLFQLEKHHADKERLAATKFAELDEKSARLRELEQELEQCTTKLARLQQHQQSVTNNDSDIQFMDEIGRLESSYLRKQAAGKHETDADDDDGEGENKEASVIDESWTSAGISPAQTSPSISFLISESRKRKNPFSKSESFPRATDMQFDDTDAPNNSRKRPTLSQLVTTASSSSTTDENDDSAEEIGFVRPIGHVGVKPASENLARATTKKLMMMRTASSSSASSLLTSSTNTSRDVSIMKPMPVKISSASSSSTSSSSSSSCYSYQYDGLGGRTRVLNVAEKSSTKPTLFQQQQLRLTSSSSSSSSSSLSKHKLTRFKAI